MFEAANARLDDIVARTVYNLWQHRALGGTEDTFQAALIGQFVAEAQQHPPGAGATHMALAVYRLAVQHQQLYHMNESIQMRDALISTLTEWEEQS